MLDREAKRPRSMASRLMAIAAELPALPVPNRDKVQAFTSQSAVDKWGDDSAGIRAVESGDNVITMFELIGEDYWSGGGITAKGVSRQLRAIGGPVEVQLNSPGGDMFEGFAIYNVLREHPYPVTIKVVGMAASAASVIAMAGNEIMVGASAFLMIHNCWCLGIGNRHDFAELSAFLEPFDTAMADLYNKRSGQDTKDIQKWMDAETYMSGQQAVDRGFADALLPSDQITSDPAAFAAAKEVNEVRSMEMALQASGLSRAQARSRIQSLKGKHDAAPKGSDEGKHDAAATAQLQQILAGVQQLLNT